MIQVDFRWLAGLWLLAVLPPVSAQPAFPSRVVRIVVPSTSGGGADALARLMAHHLTERWGKQVIVENRTGASNMLGGEFVVKSPPDGHTLLAGISTLAINPSTHKKVLFDAQRDLAPISQLVSIPNILMVHPTLHESGLIDFEAVQWYGLLAPANTPRDLTGKIYNDVFAVLKTPEVRDRMTSDGAIVAGSMGEQFAAFIKAETVKWAKVVQAAGIVPE